VYSEDELAAFKATDERPVKVIDLLLLGHIEPHIPLDTLVKMGVFNKEPPQSICHLPPERFRPARRKMLFGFRV
jgi:hypothetical protein